MTAQPDFTAGNLDKMTLSPELARILDEICGAARRCEDLSDDEIVAAMGRWQALESWASAGKLGAVVALLRRRGITAAGAREPGGLPQAWQDTLNEEVMAELGVSSRAADKMIDLAWSLAARLPATAAALSSGQIDAYKASIIQQTTSVLSDDAAGQAETAVAGKLAGKTVAPWDRKNLRPWVTDPEMIAQYDVIVALKTDRISRRDQQDFTRIEFWAIEHGKRLIIVDGRSTPPAGTATMTRTTGSGTRRRWWRARSGRRSGAASCAPPTGCCVRSSSPASPHGATPPRDSSTTSAWSPPSKGGS